MARFKADDDVELLGAGISAIKEIFETSQDPNAFLKTGKLSQALEELRQDLQTIVGCERAIRIQLKGIQHAVEDSADAVVIIDADGRFLVVNSAAENLFRVTEEQHSVRDWLSRTPFYKDDGKTRIPYNEFPAVVSVTENKEVDIELYGNRISDNAGRWMKVISRPLDVGNTNGNKGAVIFAKDITLDRSNQDLMTELKPVLLQGAVARTIIASASEAFVAIDPAGKVIHWNEKAEKLLGYKLAELKGNSLADSGIIPPESKKLFENSVAMIDRSKEVQFEHFEAKALTKDGRRLVVELAPYTANLEGLPSLCTFFRDVTQKSVLARRQSVTCAVTSVLSGAESFESMAPKILSSIGDCLGQDVAILWKLSPDKEILSFEQLWLPEHSEREEIRGLLRSISVKKTDGFVGNILGQNQPVREEQIHKGGSALAMVAEKYQLTDSVGFLVEENEKTKWIFQFLNDAPQSGDEKVLQSLEELSLQIEQAIANIQHERDQTRLVSIVESSDDAIMVLMLTGTINSWNQGAERIYGYLESEVLGKNFRMLLPQDRQTEYIDQLKKVISGEATSRFSSIHRTKTGNAVHVEMTLVPLQDKVSGIFAVSCTVRDTSEKRRKEDELNLQIRELKQQVNTLLAANDEMEQVSRRVLVRRDEALESSRFKSDFLNLMSREIRTPLNGIMGLTEMLLRANYLDEDARDYARLIYESGQSLLEVFGDILDYYRLEDNQVKLALGEVNFASLIEEAADQFVVRHRLHPLSVLTFIDPQIPLYLKGDAKRILQILSNLFDSCHKYSDRNGLIVRAALQSLGADKATLKIGFSDTGVGMFRSTEGLLKPIKEGVKEEKLDTGNLSLTVAKDLIALMGGELSLDSQVGGGTTFWFSLPLGLTAHGTEDGSLKEEIGGLRVLVIEGPSGASRMISSYCSAWGLKFDWVVTANDAIELIKSKTASNVYYHAILMENILFGTDGVTLSKKLRQFQSVKSTKIIMFSMQADSEMRAKVQQAGISALLTSPLKQSQVLKLFKRISQEFANEIEPSRKPEVYFETFSQRDHAPGEKVILLAEDNAINRKVALLQLAELGYKVDVVGNGKEAVDAVSLYDYAAVLMDCEMPELDGFEATKRIRTNEAGKGRRLPIIAMTANAIEGDRETCIAAGMDDYLSKPVDTSLLSAILEKYLDDQFISEQVEAQEMEASERTDESLSFVPKVDGPPKENDNGELKASTTTLLDQLPKKNAGDDSKAEVPAPAEKRKKTSKLADLLHPELAQGQDIDLRSASESSKNKKEDLWTIAETGSVPMPEEIEDEGGGKGSLCDLARLEKLCGPDGVRELIKEFTSSADIIVNQLEDSCRSSSREGVRKAAHALKGSASALGANQLADCCMAIQLLTEDDWMQTQLLMRILRRSYDRLKVLLQDYLA